MITKAALRLLVGLFFAAALSLTTPVTNAATTQELQQLILQLQQQVLQLQQQLQSLQGIPSTSQQVPTITRTLRLGSRDITTNGEVSKLQQFLAQDKTIYPEGLITGYFGPLTEKAVQRWQAKNGVVSSGSPATTGYGAVGPKTRAKLREVSGGVSQQTYTAPTGSGGGGGGGGGGSSTPTPPSPPEDTLQVRLIPSVRSGSAPVTGVDLTADVLGTAQGAINYTFYCNRSDAGINITSSYTTKFDNQTDTRKTAVDACSYSSPGSYFTKVIVERGNLKAEIREIITVTSSQSSLSEDTLQVRLIPSVRSGSAPVTGVDLTADVLGTAQGAINYTFYCNRSDTGVNITSSYSAKFDNQTDTRKTAVDACSYSSPGSYFTKVIVERGNLKAEIREIVTVSASTPPPPPPPLVTSSIKNGDTVLQGTVWLITVDQSTEKVEFWADGTKLSEDLTTPFQHTVTLVVGAHAIGACPWISGVRYCQSVVSTGVLARITVATVTPTPPTQTKAWDTQTDFQAGSLSGATATADGHVTLTPTTVGGGGTAAVDFVGGFESGSYQPFRGIEYEEDRPLSDSFQIVTDPIREGRYAAKIIVRQGYSLFGYNEDTELPWHSTEGQGDEYYYAFSTLFPTDWVAPYSWGIFIQWHARLDTSPPVSFNARADTAYVHVRGGNTDENANRFEYDKNIQVLNTLSKGKWNDFVAHIRWSSGSDGLVEVWHRVAGQGGFNKILTLTNVGTLQRTSRGTATNYLLWGLYRGSYCPQPTQLGCTSSMGTQPTNILYQDGFSRGRSFGAVVGASFGE